MNISHEVRDEGKPQTHDEPFQHGDTPLLVRSRICNSSEQLWAFTPVGCTTKIRSVISTYIL